MGGWVSLFVIESKLSLDMGAERIAPEEGLVSVRNSRRKKSCGGFFNLLKDRKHTSLTHISKCINRDVVVISEESGGLVGGN